MADFKFRLNDYVIRITDGCIGKVITRCEEVIEEVDEENIYLVDFFDGRYLSEYYKESELKLYDNVFKFKLYDDVIFNNLISKIIARLESIEFGIMYKICSIDGIHKYESNWLKESEIDFNKDIYSS